jgi:hypothetical protein
MEDGLRRTGKERIELLNFTITYATCAVPNVRTAASFSFFVYFVYFVVISAFDELKHRDEAPGKMRRYRTQTNWIAVDRSFIGKPTPDDFRMNGLKIPFYIFDPIFLTFSYREHTGRKSQKNGVKKIKLPRFVPCSNTGT